MNFPFILFLIASFVALGSTALAITGRHAVHALLYLILSLLSVAVIFFLLGAPFIAALEVIIYAGAIIVLFLFIIMMLNMGTRDHNSDWIQPVNWVGPGVMAALLLAVLGTAIFQGNPGILDTRVVTPQEVGISLFGPYMIGVQLAAMMLLAGLVGATHLRKRDH